MSRAAQLDVGLYEVLVMNTEVSSRLAWNFNFVPVKDPVQSFLSQMYYRELLFILFFKPYSVTQL